MQRMHNVGQIHGDISPDNLIGTQIIDFDGKYPTSFYSDNKFKDKKSDLVALARSIIYKQYANWIITRCKNKYENINKDLTLVEKVKDFQFHVSHVKSALIDKDFYQLKQYDQRPKKYFGALLPTFRTGYPTIIIFCLIFTKYHKVYLCND